MGRTPEELGRELSTVSLLFHEKVAERLGLGPSDHKCLDLASRAEGDEPMTAGRLAELTGLTTGAITGVLDRLERGGFIRREKDPRDRRQVLIRVLPERLEEIRRLFDPLQRAMVAARAHYTPEEVALIERYFGEVLEVFRAEAERLGAPGGPSERDVAAGLAAVLAGVRRGALLLRHGAVRMKIVDTSDPLLYRGHFDGREPRVRVRDGEIDIHADPSWRRTVATVELSSRVPWDVRVRGGASHLEADLRRLELESLAISGGADEVELRLPAPRTVVPVRIGGGASRVTIVRPPHAAVRVEVRGGASRLTIDTLRLGDVGGTMRWASQGGEREEARYEIEVSGGADHLTLAT